MSEMSIPVWNNFIAVYSLVKQNEPQMYPQYSFVFINEKGRFEVDDKSFTLLNGDPKYKYREGRQKLDSSRLFLYKQDGTYGFWDFMNDKFIPYPDQKRFSKLLYVFLKEMYIK